MKFNSIKEVRVADVKKYFPLSVDEYHFRFQTKIGAMKAWVDTSRDTVAVPNLDGAIKIKLLKLPNGVKPKELKQSSGAGEVTEAKLNKSASRDVNDHYENPLPQRQKHIPHSNSGININNPNLNVPHRSSGKTKSTGDFNDNPNVEEKKHSADNDMDFNIDLDDILNSEEQKVPHEEHYEEHYEEPHETPQQFSDNTNLLGEFDTHHPTNNQAPPVSKPKDEYFGDMGDLGDLGGVDFSITNKKEEKKEMADK
jgi:hypothetical protein